MFLSGYIGCAQTRVTWRQGDVWGFIGRGYPDTIVLKNLYSLKISGDGKELQSPELSIYLISSKMDTDKMHFIFFFLMGWSAG